MTEETGKPGKPKGPHKLRRLSAVQIKSLGPGRHADGHGLALLVAPGGNVVALVPTTRAEAS